MKFSHEKFLLRNFLEFVGNGIGMPMLSGNNSFGKFRSLEIRSHREFLGNDGSILPKQL